MILFLATVANSQTPTGLPPLAARFFEEGVQLDRAGDHAGAALRFAKVVELEPAWREGWCWLGSSYARSGRLDEARAAWSRSPWHPRCIEAEGRSWLQEDPERALARFEALAVMVDHEPWTDLLLAQAQAPSDVDAARESLRRYFQRRRRRGGSPDLLAAALAVHRSMDDPGEAELFLQEMVEREPALEPGLAEAWLETKVERRVQALMGATPVPLDAEQRAALLRARRAFAAGKREEASQELERLADRVARNADVWASLAEVREAMGDIAGADAAIELACRLDPLAVEHHLQAASLLVEHYGGRFDNLALAHLERALDVRDDPALRERYVRLAIRARRYAEAERALVGAMERGEGWARPLLEALRRERPPPLQLPPVPPPADPEAWRAAHRSRVFEELASRGGRRDPDLLRRAVEEADRALSLAPDLPLALRQRARLHVISGEPDRAIALYRRLLQREPDDAETLGRLAELLLETGADDGEAMLERAARAGSAYALVERARRAVEQHRYDRAWISLKRYFQLFHTSPWHPEAVALRADLHQRLGGGAAAVAGVVGLGLVAVARRLRGVGIVGLVERHPRLLPEVTRLLAAIRHEVLKHNVSTFPDWIERCRQGRQPSVEALERRIQQARERFGGYVQQLEQTAARAGVPLDLRHRDPVFRVGIRAMDQLRGRPEPARLERCTAVLLGPFREGLTSMVRGFGLVRLDAAFVEQAWRIVEAERPEEVARVVFQCDDERAAKVRIPQPDLVDILVNLLRNALIASVEEGRERVQVRFGEEEDPITGVVRAEVRVCDQVERTLTTAMIRGRYVERGLGLAVDRINSVGGSIHVEPEPGWSKAVVVRLPLEEGA